ncbi:MULTISPECIES: BadF/BadG/BcrA/BcrD ATPase family protein [unclassified Halorhodospira]|uniref:BadF/BadG/BcrA/BcrD ATPase family protein n=1 Tax=unclassified Halorhodospira TaxID=2626748 RepID=UPI001EE93AD6|nr:MULTISPECIES: BadF/BadG/BcrA/BcrD ATPase family protein [unclassified Halorhodospira]MCG5540460.1 acyl-CoA dehydratase activase-related protein [Halorhodospira sp. M39old]MCG5545044.1 acyl-CoA dehydratase activase-related protein [Halorhodospira sp. M38]
MPSPADHAPILVGLDVGSTTVKAVVIDGADDTLLWHDYRRHETRQLETVRDFLARIEAAIPAARRENLRLFTTGSGGGSVARALGARFVQEVHAVSLAVESRFPDVGSVVELGGQDAKIIVFKSLEDGSKRKIPAMNDKCAGGTGAVIDKIAAKLTIAPERLGDMGYVGHTVHPVAGKCGVFAETDINSLQKQGVAAEELMASLFEAIVQQNLSVLTRGHTLHPRVLLLGGPNTYIRGLQECWRSHIQALWEERGVDWNAPLEAAVHVPEQAQYFAALGAVAFGRSELADDPDAGRYPGPGVLDDWLTEQRTGGRRPGGAPPLVQDSAELETFLREFQPQPWQPARFSPGERVTGYVGIDAGSTSTKGVLLDPDGEVLAKAYRLSGGNPIEDAVALLAELETAVLRQGAELEVLGVGTTGYAKDILRDVLHADTAVVETVAHAHACEKEHPGTDCIVDVGGQDIKLMFLRDGRVRDFRLNTQCSAGNGYFLQATARAFGIELEDYAETALSAEAMPVFNHGCAVFLQSDIVDFQRKGWQRHEILAGLAAVLPKNIWLYVAQQPNPADLGRRFVLQGGTQHNLAAVKAQVDYLRERFRQVGAECDIRVHRHCGESGAIGAGLEARRLHRSEHRRSTFIGFERARRLQHHTIRDERTRCRFCRNLCLRTFIDVATGDVTEPATGADTPPRTSVPLAPGFRRVIIASCEQGEVEDKDTMQRIKAALDRDAERNPNHLDRAAREVFRTPQVEGVADPLPQTRLPGPLGRPAARRRAAMAYRRQVRIGIPRVLNLYSCAPFFLGYFTALGVPERALVFSDYTDPELYRRGANRGSIDPCFPSKLGIPHVHNLLTRKHRRRPLTHIFFPMIKSLPGALDGALAAQACPTVPGTAEATHAAFRREGDVFAEHGIRFRKTLVNLDDAALCAEQMRADWGEELGISARESRGAAEQGLAALHAFHERMEAEQRQTLQRLEQEGRVGIGVLGRPYHNDPGINHGILDDLQRKGYPILWQDALPRDPATLEQLFGAEVRAGAMRSALAIDDVWKHDFSEHSSRKLWAAKFIARHPNLVAVELSNFKCGHDAPIYSVIEAIIEQSGTPYFCFKDLDENRPGGSIQIRTETIDYFLRRYQAELPAKRSAA